MWHIIGQLACMNISHIYILKNVWYMSANNWDYCN